MTEIKKIIFTLLLLTLCNYNYAQSCGEKVYSKVNPAVVRIYSYGTNGNMEGQGSGVILKSKRCVITNAHVAGSGKVLYAEHNGTFFELDSFIVNDNESDLMIISIRKNKTDDDLKKIPDLKIFDTDKIKTGQRVYAIGSPLGFENTISEGIISGIRKAGFDTTFKYLQISAPISPGSSGGAVVDAKGRLLGISTSVMAGEAVQNINFAIPMNKVLEVAKNGGKKIKALPPYDTCYIKAYEEIDMRHYGHALGYFQMAAQQAPSVNDKRNLHYMIGQCYLNLQEPDSSISYLESATDIPAKKYVYYYLGKAWMMKKNYGRAENAFQVSISVDSNFVDAYNGMALLCLKQNQLKNTAGWLIKSTRIKNLYPETFYLEARLNFKMGDYDEAIKILEDLIVWKPDYADAIYYLSMIYLEKGNTDKSFTLQQRAFELKPELRYYGVE